MQNTSTCLCAVLAHCAHCTKYRIFLCLVCLFAVPLLCYALPASAQEANKRKDYRMGTFNDNITIGKNPHTGDSEMRIDSPAPPQGSGNPDEGIPVIIQPYYLRPRQPATPEPIYIPPGSNSQ